MRATHAPIWLALLTACAAPPTPVPVPVHAPFPLAYEGHLAPLAEPLFAEASHPASMRPDFEVRAWVIEMPVAEARRLVPELVAAPPPAVETLPDGGERRWTADRVEVRGAASAASPRIPGLGVRGALALRDDLRAAVDAAMMAGRVQGEGTAAVVPSGRGAATIATRIAYVRAIDYEAVADSVIARDIRVDVVDHGSQIWFEVTPVGDDRRIGIEWLQHLAVQKVTADIAAVRGAIEVPVMLTGRVTGEVVVAPGEGVIVAGMPGVVAGNVQLLVVQPLN